MAENTNGNSTEPETKTEPSVEELNAEIKSLKAQLEKQKQAFNNASSDAADWKKKFRDTQDEATRKEADRNEEVENLKKKVAEFERQTSIANQKAALVAMGYPEELAAKKAGYLADNDIQNATLVEKEFLENLQKEMKAASVRGMTTPASGFQTGNTVTKETFAKMSLRERTELKQKHPEVYEAMTKH